MNTSSTESERLYVNSYTQRISGNDTTFTVSLGQPKSFSSIQLDQAAIETIFCNLYPSQDVDFRLFSFDVLVGGSTYTVQGEVDVFIQSTTALCDYLQAVMRSQWEALAAYTIVSVPVPSYRYGTWALQVRNGAGVAVTSHLNSSGLWFKMGFTSYDWDTVALTHTSPSSYDLSLSPCILLRIEEIVPCIQNQHGQGHFVIPLTSAFGSKTFYLNTQAKTCQTIRLQNTVTVSQLTFTLLSCDQTVMLTPRYDNADYNQCGIECVFLFQINRE